MTTLLDSRDPAQMLQASRLARHAVAQGELIVLPTDTVYGLAANAFDHRAVRRLLAAKGRGRGQPPPVLVASREAMEALVESVPEAVERLVERFWPGALTIVLPAQRSLTWDLGETEGTVAVRMPDHPFAMELLHETGPLAVSSANLTGMPAATTIEQAQDMLGEAVSVYLDAGESSGGTASTIIDATSLVAPTNAAAAVRVLREGAISRDELADLLGDLLDSAAPQGATEASGSDPTSPQSAADAPASDPEVPGA